MGLHSIDLSSHWEQDDMSTWTVEIFFTGKEKKEGTSCHKLSALAEKWPPVSSGHPNFLVLEAENNQQIGIQSQRSCILISTSLNSDAKCCLQENIASPVFSPLPDTMVLQEVNHFPDSLGLTEWTAIGVCRLYEWHCPYYKNDGAEWNVAAFNLLGRMSW